MRLVGTQKYQLCLCVWREEFGPCQCVLNMRRFLGRNIELSLCIFLLVLTLVEGCVCVLWANSDLEKWGCYPHFSDKLSKPKMPMEVERYMS